MVFETSAHFASICHGTRPTQTNVILLYGNTGDDRWKTCSFLGLQSLSILRPIGGHLGTPGIACHRLLFINPGLSLVIQFL